MPNIIKAPAANQIPANPNRPAAPRRITPFAKPGRAAAAERPYSAKFLRDSPISHIPAPAIIAAAPRTNIIAAKANIRGITGAAAVEIPAIAVTAKTITPIMTAITTVIAASIPTAAQPCSAAAAMPIPISQKPAPTRSTATPSCINGTAAPLRAAPSAASPRPIPVKIILMESAMACATVRITFAAPVATAPAFQKAIASPASEEPSASIAAPSTTTTPSVIFIAVTSHPKIGTLASTQSTSCTNCEITQAIGLIIAIRTLITSLIPSANH